MGLQYNKKAEGHSQDTMWTSYSDLFLGLSVIFLLLYVVASIRQGTDGVKQHIENQNLKKEVEDLRTQISLYDNLKKDYIEKEASPQEQDSYKLLMDKLSLLQEEAKDEKSKLELKAQENEEKAVALNQYQQMIRNIVNANILSKTKVKRRDSLISEKNTIISDQTQEIGQLENSLTEKQQELRVGEDKINELQNNLENKISDLNKAYKQQKISKANFEKERLNLKQQTEQQVAELEEKNKKASSIINQINNELAQTQKTLASAGEENQALKNEMSAAEEKHQKLLNKLQEDHANQKAADRARLEDELKKHKLTTAQREAREKQYRDEVAKKEQDLRNKIATLDKDLSKANEKLNAQKNLAKKIKGDFAKAGISADIDPGTGDVVLSFGEHYFDTGKASLKPEMQRILERAMPIYSKNLFQDGKVSKKLQSVEIIGFASPTFKGKQVNPNDLKLSDKSALNFNLDLSFDRAKSIFNYVFDKKNMDFQYQDELFPIVKVSGRSFLGQGNGKDFCSKNDCAKLQRVIIKFNLKD
ncbi:MAG TPA: microtubule-binding protein [Pseudobdellovibrionaceae bacterium]|nr:microtubule-binding protein [Pseudobdellovibrionaceae bacterium]